MAVTNADLLREIASNHQAVEQRLDRLEAKVDTTNGRVTKLELWRERMGGFAAAFSWGPMAFAAAVAGVIVWLVTN